MSDHDVAGALARSTLFGGLEPSERDTLARECRIRQLAKGERLFSRGDSGTGMFVLAEGSICLSVVSVEGAEVVLAVLRATATFGELAVVDGRARVATATARESSSVVFVPAQPVIRLVMSDPAFALDLLRSLGAMVRRIDEVVTDLVLLDLPGRVSRFLASQLEPAVDGVPPQDIVAIDLRLTQTELAQLVGGSRQQVNRVLRDLEDVGAIVRVRSRVVAVRPDVLRRRR
jgi:CRP-like cAMP-binding protein